MRVPFRPTASFALTLWKLPMIERLNSDHTPSIEFVCTSPTTPWDGKT